MARKGPACWASFKAFSNIPGLLDIRPLGVNRDAAGKLGISEASVADALMTFSSGDKATTVKEVQKEIPVTMYLGDPKQNVNLESFKHVPLRTSGGSMVPLENIADFTWEDIPSEINHEHLTRKITVTANVKGRTSDAVAKDMEMALRKIPMETGYDWGFTGKYKTEKSALQSLLFVRLLVIVTVDIPPNAERLFDDRGGDAGGHRREKRNHPAGLSESPTQSRNSSRNCGSHRGVAADSSDSDDRFRYYPRTTSACHRGYLRSDLIHRIYPHPTFFRGDPASDFSIERHSGKVSYTIFS